MNIALAQLNFHIGNFKSNTDKMLSKLEEARKKGADLILFSELATCGYPPRDFLEFRDFIHCAEEAINELREASQGIAVVVGSPTINPLVDGKDLYNSAYFLYDKKVLGVAHKALLPTYDIFDEYRYFEPAHDFEVIEFMGHRIALTVCEDIWNIANDNPLYTVCPMDQLQDQGCDLLLNLSASPFDYKHAQERIRIVQANAQKYKVPVFYSNHVGAQTEIIFDGGSLVCSPDGIIMDEMPYFEECMNIYSLEEVSNYKGAAQVQKKEKIALIHDALLCGIQDYFRKLKFKKAIIGLSGGIDSALTAVLATRALGPENVHVLLMPSHYSSDHSVKDAEDLARNLGIRYEILNIQKPYYAFEDVLSEAFEGTSEGIAEENIQSRCRGVILMAMSNKFGHILLNTTNKSEMAVGYGTLYGDLAGGISVIGDVYKSEVFEMCRWINREAEIIPWNTITKPPSAELRPDQKDTDSLPPYEVLDPILHDYIEERLGPQEIVDQGNDPELVARILRLVNINEFKRHQTAPVLRVSPKAFGMGRRMPIVAKYLS